MDGHNPNKQESGAWENLPRIFSKQNQRFKDAQKLLTTHGAKKQNALLLEGWRASTLAAELDAEILDIFVEDSEAGRAFLEDKDLAAHRVTILSAELYRALALTTTPTQPLAVVRRPETSRLTANALKAHRRVLVLDRIQDPGNVGTLLRTAAAFGFTAVILTRGAASIFTKKLWRAAMGAMPALALFDEASPEETVRVLREAGHKLAVADLDGETPDNLRDAPEAIALVLGNEGQGPDRVFSEAADRVLTIPMTDAVESLNVAAAGAILCYALADLGD